MSTEDRIKIPTPARFERLVDSLKNDDDFRFPRIKLNRDKPRYEIPAPTSEDRDAITSAPSFTGVVVLARKNFYLSDEDREAGKEAKEKRELYVLRSGRITPEQIYVSPTSMKAWQIFVKECINSDQKFYTVICEFSAERIKSQKGYTWNKMKFHVSRFLTEEELAHVLEVRALVDSCVRVYEDDTELAKIEDEAISEGRPRSTGPEAHSKATAAELEEDDEAEAPKPKKATKADEPPKKKARPAPAEDDDETPKPKKDPKPAADDDEEDDKPKTKPGYPPLDEDDDEDLPKKAAKAKPADDEDED